MPTWPDYDTVNRPFPDSHHANYYSDLWNYEVLCHPDAYRDPTAIFLWTGTLWASVLYGGVWVLWKRGEISVQYANWMRLGVFAMVPFISWVSFGVPIVQSSVSTAFAFMVGLGKAGCDRGNWRDLRRIVHFAKGRAGEVWVETAWLACGHAASLPIQNTQITMEEPTVAKEERAAREIDLQKKEGTRMSFPDEEKRVLHSEALDSAPYLSGPANTDGSSISNPLRYLQAVATVLLGYLSIITLLLCERRISIKANAIIDDILWHLAVAGLAINAQAVILLLRATAPPQQKGSGQQAAPIHLPPSLDEPSSQTSDTTESSSTTISCILLARFGGLVHGVNANTKASDRSILMALGRVGPFDILTSIIIFRHLVHPRSGNDDYPHIDKLINIASKTMLLAMFPYLWIITFALVALTLTVAHLLLSSVLPNSRAVVALERLSPMMENLVRWVNVRYARAPESLRWVLERCYFPLWTLCVYGALNIIVIQEIVRFDTRERLRANNLPYLDLWRDPLVEKLLWPVFWAVGN
jgi:hypothetical protein